MARPLIPKSFLDELVMEWLVLEGHKSAASCFQQESGIEPGIDLSSISARVAIRKAVESGDIGDAIDRTNDLDPDILDTNPRLFFMLQKQRLVELIRTGSTDAALLFAKTDLAPLGEHDPWLLGELEEAMALLAFQGASGSCSQELLSESHRAKTASELNAAILVSQNQSREARLPHLLRCADRAEAQLADARRAAGVMANSKG